MAWMCCPSVSECTPTTPYRNACGIQKTKELFKMAGGKIYRQFAVIWMT